MLERTGTAESVESLKGKKAGGKGGQKQGGQAVGDADLRPAFKALQTAWIRLVGSPFYAPEDRAPMAPGGGEGRGGEITSKRFLGEVRRIGEGWRPGLTTL